LIYMGVDYGDARTGIASTDAGGTLAVTKGSITEYNKQKLAQKLSDKMKELNAEAIVMGLPLNMNGTEGERALKTKELAKILEEEYNCKVILWDERCTTVMAHNIMNFTDTRGKKRKQTVDSLSAVLILQSYIDFKNKNL